LVTYHAEFGEVRRDVIKLQIEGRVARVLRIQLCPQLRRAYRGVGVCKRERVRE
jgi:hypothetical protein